MSAQHHEPIPTSPTWASGARQAALTLPSGAVVAAWVADDDDRRRLGWSLAPAPDPGGAILFSFDVVSTHGFWMRDVAFDLDLAFLDPDGVVLAVHRLVAGDEELVHPPEPIRYALEVPAGAIALAVGERVVFDAGDVAPEPRVYEPEPPLEPDPHDDPLLVERWCRHEHAYSSRPFATVAALLNWQLRVGPDDTAIWLHAGGGFVMHPPVCPLAELAALARALRLAWLRLELGPRPRLRLPDGRIVIEPFDPRTPDDWLARMSRYGLFPTTGRWQQTRTMVVDLAGDVDALFARLPTRIRYEARSFARAVETGRYRVETVPGGALDLRQQRAVDALHHAWMEARPGVDDNYAFCRPFVHGFGPSVTAHLCWQGTELLAVQYHVLWDGTFYYLFSETVQGAPQGLTPGLLWHGIHLAKTAPFGPSPAPDLLDLVGGFDPRYPDFRPWGKGYTASKLRWHPTTVWLPPSVAFAGSELPP